MAVQPIPDRYHSITPYLSVTGAKRLLEFLKRAFDAEVEELMGEPDGRVRHAEVRIGDSIVMVAEGSAAHPPMPAVLYLYVADVDAAFAKAVAGGAVVIRPLATQFYGDRSAGLIDPSGNHWWIATHVEDVDPEEMTRRMAANPPQV